MKLVPELEDVVNLDINPLSDMVFKVEPDRDGQILKIWFDEWSYNNLQWFTEMWIPSTWTFA